LYQKASFGLLAVSFQAIDLFPSISLA